MAKRRPNGMVIRRMKKTEPLKKCCNDKRIDFTVNGAKFSKCKEEAIFAVDDHDYITGKDVTAYYCRHCAEFVDDSIRERKAEAQS